MSYDPAMDTECGFEWADHICLERPNHEGDHVCGGCGGPEPQAVGPSDA